MSEIAILRKESVFVPSCHVKRRRQCHPTPVLLPGKSHGRRSLVGCSPWGREELDTTERLHFHFSLSCIGEGNGNPLQCSCLENPRDRGAWWAAVCGVAQGRKWLKWLSSSCSLWRSSKKTSRLWTRSDPQPTSAVSVPWCWAYQPPGLWETNVCCLGHSISGTFIRAAVMD